MSNQTVQIADGIRQTYTPRLNTVMQVGFLGLRRWLSTSENFIPVDTGNSDIIELSLYDVTECMACWASDISRLACASLETVMCVNENASDKKFLAWQLVEYYYSAFYSAHCTLKICGFGLVQIDGTIIANIRRRATTLGLSAPNYTRGIYCVQVFPSQSKIILSRISKYDDSHKGLWHRYADYLGVLSGVTVLDNGTNTDRIRIKGAGEDAPFCVYSQLPMSDAQVIVSRIDEIRNAINQKGDNNWLSSVRNAINYNHSFGVWYPFKQFEEALSKITDMNFLFMKDPLHSDFVFCEEHELIKFVKCCQLINSINRTLLIDLAERHPENRSFLRTGPLSYINLHTNRG